MKAYNFLLATILLLTAVNSPARNNTIEDERKIIEMSEQIWMKSGLQAILLNFQEQKNINQTNFKYFVIENWKTLEDIKIGYFQLAKSTSSIADFEQHSLAYLRKAEETCLNLLERHDFSLEPENQSIHLTNTSQSFVTGCGNSGFESTQIFEHWEAMLGDACYHHKGVPDYSCFGFISTPYVNASSVNRLVVEDGTTPFDPLIGGTLLPTTCPFNAGSKSLRLENRVNGFGASQASYDFKVDSNNPFFIYNYAVVLEDPGTSHPDSAKPFFAVSIYDNTAQEFIECASYEVFANPQSDEDFKNFKAAPNNPYLMYKNWTKAIIPLAGRLNHDLTINFIVSDCPWGGHLGYAYLDAECFDPSISAGGCESNGTRKLTIPDYFATYNWMGNEVISDSEKPEVYINGTGKFKCDLRAESRCKMSLETVVSPCPGQNDPQCQVDLVQNTVAISPCNTNTNFYDVSFDITHSNLTENHYVVAKLGENYQTFKYPFSSTISCTFNNLIPDGKDYVISIYVFKGYFFKFGTEKCSDSFTYTSPTPCVSIVSGCLNCLKTFAPIPGEKYILGAWVRDPNAVNVKSYVNPHISISFSVSSGTPPPPLNVYASGQIIEGWQRIEYSFEIPANGSFIHLELDTDNGIADFDDIRVFPSDGNMQSYVYDPVSLKLVATLDENNYATFYEYDQEGKLIRTKKETSRGIMTISENRQSTLKK